jgi:hypothetical protein
MPFSDRAYLIYVDDSGNEAHGWLWTALALPNELWTDHLRRWLSFRRWLYKQHAVPANFELHAQVWLSSEPSKHTADQQLDLVRDRDGDLVPIIRRGREHRRARFEVYEKALKTIGSLPDAALFTTHTASSTGPAKFELYGDLLCFLESFLFAERAHASLIVDGLNDGGGHVRAAHRALRINRRRVLEDASHRSSADSQLLQMTDLCAYAALQSIQAKATVDPRFRAQYETTLSRVIVRPSGLEDGRSIRGLDYSADRSECPSERAR